MNLPLRNSRIKLSQGNIFWREIGHRGPILVFLHGSWETSNQWLPLLKRLGESYHCFAVDLLGFGDSDRPVAQCSIALETEFLGEYLAALNLRQVYLIGHSLGSWVAASYAVKHLEQVQGLVLLAPEGVQVQGLEGRWRWSRWLVGRLQLVPWLLRLLYPLARLFGQGEGMLRSQRLRRKLQQSPMACKLLFQRRRAEIQSEQLQEQLGDLKVPVLIVQGGQDTAAASMLSQAYAGLLPQADLKILAEGDGYLPQTLPDELAKQIQDFVALAKPR